VISASNQSGFVSSFKAALKISLTTLKPSSVNLTVVIGAPPFTFVLVGLIPVCTTVLVGKYYSEAKVDAITDSGVELSNE
jgi:hypothetical protein